MPMDIWFHGLIQRNGVVGVLLLDKQKVSYLTSVITRLGDSRLIPKTYRWDKDEYRSYIVSDNEIPSSKIGTEFIASYGGLKNFSIDAGHGVSIHLDYGIPESTPLYQEQISGIKGWVTKQFVVQSHFSAASQLDGFYFSALPPFVDLEDIIDVFVYPNSYAWALIKDKEGHYLLLPYFKLHFYWTDSLKGGTVYYLAPDEFYINKSRIPLRVWQLLHEPFSDFNYSESGSDVICDPITILDEGMPIYEILGSKPLYSINEPLECRNGSGKVNITLKNDISPIVSIYDKSDIPRVFWRNVTNNNCYLPLSVSRINDNNEFYAITYSRGVSSNPYTPKIIFPANTVFITTEFFYFENYPAIGDVEPGLGGFPKGPVVALAFDTVCRTSTTGKTVTYKAGTQFIFPELSVVYYLNDFYLTPANATNTSCWIPPYVMFATLCELKMTDYVEHEIRVDRILANGTIDNRIISELPDSPSDDSLVEEGVFYRDAFTPRITKVEDGDKGEQYIKDIVKSIKNGIVGLKRLDNVTILSVPIAIVSFEPKEES